MGVKAAGFLRGRLMMHGAEAETPVTVVENASRPDQKTISTTLLAMPDAIAAAGISGPAVCSTAWRRARLRRPPARSRIHEKPEEL
jgi:siroheme synthase